MNPTSAHHPFLKAIRRAASAGRPTEDGLIVAEGPHLLEEAWRSPWNVEVIVCTTAAASRFHALIAGRSTKVTPAQLMEIPAKTFSQIASTESAQEILCLLRPQSFSWPDLFAAPALVVVLDSLQDPGNAGAIVRSAEAFGATGLVFLEGSVRVSNPKFLRAAAGSAFRLPFLERIETGHAIRELQRGGLSLSALSADAGQTIRQACFTQPTALIVGSEGAGVSEEFRRVSQRFSIPTGQVESLNAAVACSLALYEAHNQRAIHS